MSHHLYRHFDSNGELLYIGISLSAVQRLSQHKQTAHWFKDIAKVEIEHFSSPETAHAAEVEAIAIEKPKFNIAHQVEDIDPMIKWRRDTKAIEDRRKKWYKLGQDYFITGKLRIGDIVTVSCIDHKRYVSIFDRVPDIHGVVIDISDGRFLVQKYIKDHLPDTASPFLINHWEDNYRWEQALEPRVIIHHSPALEYNSNLLRKSQERHIGISCESFYHRYSDEWVEHPLDVIRKEERTRSVA